MRLVDADWLLEGLSHFNDTKNGNKHFFYGIESAKEIIENADKVELVRCKDCVWWDKWHDFNTRGDCQEIGLSTDCNDYCSMAIKKEDEK